MSHSPTPHHKSHGPLLVSLMPSTPVPLTPSLSPLYPCPISPPSASLSQDLLKVIIFVADCASLCELRHKEPSQLIKHSPTEQDWSSLTVGG